MPNFSHVEQKTPQSLIVSKPAAKPHAPVAHHETAREPASPDSRAVSAHRPVGYSLATLRIFPKLTVTPAGDSYEQEADAVASQVVQRMNTPVSRIETAPENQYRKQNNQHVLPIIRIQRKGVDPAGGMAVSTALESQIQAVRGSGSPIAEGVRHKMENAFGANFSAVRIHTNSQADALSRSVQARAFTTGQDIFFRQGEYQPESNAGQALAAHELAHVLQQGSTVMRVAQRAIPDTTANWQYVDKIDSHHGLKFTYPWRMEGIISQKSTVLKGSGPDNKADWWPFFQERHKRMALGQTSEGGKIYWVQGHLLNDNIHGPGVPGNLVPLSNTSNTNQETKGETLAKKLVLTQGKVIRYIVQAHWNTTPDNKFQAWGAFNHTGKGLLPGECTAPDKLSWQIWTMRETQPDVWVDDVKQQPPEDEWYNTFPEGHTDNQYKSGVSFLLN